MKTIVMICIIIVMTAPAFSQVGINTTAPHSSAILDLSSTEKGLLIPTMTTSDRESMAMSPPVSGLADGLLVFDVQLFCFYYWDSSVGKWVAVNPWRREHEVDPEDTMHVTTTLNTVSNVGIGVDSPSSKLTVEGNLSVGNSTITAPDDGIYSDGKVRIGNSSGSSEMLEVGGDVNITQTTTSDEFVGRGVVPTGTVITWAPLSGDDMALLFDPNGVGYAGTKVEGWAICNGYNGVPNLVDRFVVGAGRDGEDNNLSGNRMYDVNTAGGYNSVTLVSENMPSHSHSGSTNTAGNHSHVAYIDAGGGGSHGSGDMWTDDDGGSSMCYGCAGNGYLPTNTTGNHSHSLTTDNAYGNALGNADAHENRPPYYALYYLIRIN